MKCQTCAKSDATVQLTEIVAGKATQLRLCEACVRRRDLGLPGWAPYSPALDVELGTLPKGEAFRPEEYPEEARGGPCPSCGHFNQPSWNFCSACGAMRQP